MRPEFWEAQTCFSGGSGPCAAVVCAWLVRLLLFDQIGSSGRAHVFLVHGQLSILQDNH